MLNEKTNCSTIKTYMFDSQKNIRYNKIVIIRHKTKIIKFIDYAEVTPTASRRYGVDTVGVSFQTKYR